MRPHVSSALSFLDEILLVISEKYEEWRIPFVISSIPLLFHAYNAVSYSSYFQLCITSHSEYTPPEQITLQSVISEYVHWIFTQADIVLHH